MRSGLTLPRRATAADQYLALELNSRLDAASPHKLVSILYEELQRALEVAVRTLAAGRGIAVHPQVNRAQSILMALEASLDFKAGGTLSHSLAAVYRSMRKELSQAARAGDSLKLSALQKGVESVANAWASVGR
jgi:flagellar secretion chaperone FliS